MVVQLNSFGWTIRLSFTVCGLLYLHTLATNTSTCIRTSQRVSHWYWYCMCTSIPVRLCTLCLCPPHTSTHWVRKAIETWDQVCAVKFFWLNYKAFLHSLWSPIPPHWVRKAFNWYGCIVDHWNFTETPVCFPVTQWCLLVLFSVPQQHLTHPPFSILLQLWDKGHSYNLL